MVWISLQMDDKKNRKMVVSAKKQVGSLATESWNFIVMYLFKIFKLKYFYLQILTNCSFANM